MRIPGWSLSPWRCGPRAPGPEKIQRQQKQGQSGGVQGASFCIWRVLQLRSPRLQGVDPAKPLLWPLPGPTAPSGVWKPERLLHVSLAGLCVILGRSPPFGAPPFSLGVWCQGGKRAKRAFVLCSNVGSCDGKKAGSRSWADPVWIPALQWPGELWFLSEPQLPHLQRGAVDTYPQGCCGAYRRLLRAVRSTLARGRGT